MIDLDFIERLLKAFDDSSVDSLEIERGGTRVKLAKTPPTPIGAPAAAQMIAAPAPVAVPAAPPAPAAAQPAAPEAAPAAETAPSGNLVDIESPMVGTFYRAPAPDAASYVDLGSSVAPGDTLCIIEAMKLMNELECEVSGTIREICVENAQPVEYGQVLFRVEPT